MYLDPELQVIVTTPVAGVETDIVVAYESDNEEEVLRHLESHSTSVTPLPESMAAITTSQKQVLNAISHSAITQAALDDELVTLQLQVRRQLQEAARKGAKLTR